MSVALSAADAGAAPRHSNAYATMMYMGTPRDYEFFVAIRVMMQSLARHKADADLIVIASTTVPPRWIRTLNKEGVKVVSVTDIPNPYKGMDGFNDRFMFTLNKIYAWSLTDYERVVMLDADNMFLHNTDELFQCGEFCACFINPCYFHTGLFVLKPSNETFQDMLEVIKEGRENNDGADQGLLTAYFSDLLERPLFTPPRNGSKLDGLYRLPLGYQMDASYYCKSGCGGGFFFFSSFFVWCARWRAGSFMYLSFTLPDLRLKWNVPCGPNSVITFPSIPLLKPWYWWAWPVLPLGLSWHEQRRKSIGYGTEIPILAAESIFYLITMTVSLVIRRRFSSSEKVPLKSCLGRCPCPDLTQFFYRLVAKLSPVVAIVMCFVLPFFVIPTTVHPVMGWSVLLLGSLSYLVITANVFQLPVFPTMTPWVGIAGVLVVMALPVYVNGIVRSLAIGTYAFLAAPFLWWALRVVASREVGFAREALMAYGRQEPQQSAEMMKLC
ncbi:hypothetical protein SELMODRAFT_180548 [Selaginella moellendorffii]|uniref:Uncharacterized protein n=2 Tax=Selaginella moellendorffii TaxID=88036 RepID=D8SKH9_SELML|nr:hypothetical protein SELMODRAFT_180548 [Selaginella moellendorffii]